MAAPLEIPFETAGTVELESGVSQVAAPLETVGVLRVAETSVESKQAMAPAVAAPLESV